MQLYRPSAWALAGIIKTCGPAIQCSILTIVSIRGVHRIGLDVYNPTMDHLHYRLNFGLDKYFITA